LHGLRTEGQTALYDALYGVCQGMRAASEAPPVRRVIIVFSDGEDNWSRHGLDDAILMALQADVTIYAITVHHGRLQLGGDKVLRRLAETTGGQAFKLKRSGTLERVFAAIEAGLRAHYLVSFRPPTAAPPPGYHTLKITVRDRKLRVQARAGYYAD